MGRFFFTKSNTVQLRGHKYKLYKNGLIWMLGNVSLAKELLKSGIGYPIHH
jgi:hypothetical protein